MDHADTLAEAEAVAAGGGEEGVDGRHKVAGRPQGRDDGKAAASLSNPVGHLWQSSPRTKAPNGKTSN